MGRWKLVWDCCQRVWISGDSVAGVALRTMDWVRRQVTRIRMVRKRMRPSQRMRRVLARVGVAKREVVCGVVMGAAKLPSKKSFAVAGRCGRMWVETELKSGAKMPVALRKGTSQAKDQSGDPEAVLEGEAGAAEEVCAEECGGDEDGDLPEGVEECGEEDAVEFNHFSSPVCGCVVLLWRAFRRGRRGCRGRPDGS